MRRSSSRLPTVILAALAVVGLRPATAGADPVAREVVGAWERPFTEAGANVTMTLNLSADGSYQVYRSDQDPALQSGTITAGDGKYHLVNGDTAGDTAQDGTYELSDGNNTLALTAATVVTYRRSVPYRTEPPADAPLMFNAAGPDLRDQVRARAAAAAQLRPMRGAVGGNQVVQPSPAVTDAAALLERAAELVDAGHGADAIPLLRQVRPLYRGEPADAAVRGWAELAAGDPVAARRAFDDVLNARPGLADAYLGRGLAAGRAGDLRRLRADLAVARSLSSSVAAKFEGDSRDELAAIAAAGPTRSPADLAVDLMRAATAGDPQLARTAADLIRATDADRRVPAERYQDGVRDRAAVVLANPNDPRAWADLADYVYQENDSRYPAGQVDRVEHEADRLRAMRLAKEALGINSWDVTALAVKGWLLREDGQNADALAVAREGKAILPDGPRFTKLENVLLAENAAKSEEAASDLRAPKSWTRHTPEWTIVYGRPPSTDELARAAQLDGEATANVTQANRQALTAWAQCAGDTAKMNMAAEFLLWSGDADRAVALWRQVLDVDPRNAQALRSLAACDRDAGRADDAFEMGLRLANLFQTSAAPLTRRAADRLAAGDGDGARADLRRAVGVDPADPAVYLGLSRVDAGPAAAADLRCADALARAVAVQRGVRLDASDPVDADQVAGLVAVWTAVRQAADAAGRADVADRYRRGLDALAARTVPLPVAVADMARRPMHVERGRALVDNAARDARVTAVALLLRTGDMETLARFCLAPRDGLGFAPREVPYNEDILLPMYRYLRTRLDHYQLWHYISPDALAAFDLTNPPEQAAP